jgi:hypothetical protein
MINSSLQEYAERILKAKRISKHDVQHLRRDRLADGLMSREEAEILIGLDRNAETVHATWPSFFIEALTEFAVWGSRPTGYIDRDTAQWLAAALMRDGGSPRTTRVLREVIAEAQQADESLRALMNAHQASVSDATRIRLAAAA